MSGRVRDETDVARVRDVPGCRRPHLAVAGNGADQMADPHGAQGEHVVTCGALRVGRVRAPRHAQRCFVVLVHVLRKVLSPRVRQSQATMMGQEGLDVPHGDLEDLAEAVAPRRPVVRKEYPNNVRVLRRDISGENLEALRQRCRRR